MADYKAIHGKTIQHLASDLDDSEAEGQIWFNTATSDYKTIVKADGAWATGGALNTARAYIATVGLQTAALAILGGPHPKANTESYDGSS